MNITINKTACVHFLLLYLMVCWNDTFVYNIYLQQAVVPVAILFAIILILSMKYRDQNALLFCGFLFFVVIFIRLFAGGIGIQVLSIWISSILLTVIAIKYDIDNFADRYVKLICFLALISLVMYAMVNFLPGLFNSLPMTEYRSGWTYNIWSSGSEYKTYDYYNKGLLFYVSRENEVRNLSIFEEPGKFQMHLNAALFMFVFLRDRINLKRASIWIIILAVALITCQSTTGYITFIVLIIAYLFSNGTESAEKGRILAAIAVVVAGLSLDYFVNADESVIYSVVYLKLFTQSWSVTASTAAGISTGAYRLQTILICLQLIIQNPFGAGYDVVNEAMSTTTAAGSTIWNDAAAIGIIPMIIILIWVIRLMVKNNLSTLVKITLVFMYFNTALAQSSEFYPALLCIGLYLRYQSEEDSYLFDDETNENYAQTFSNENGH